MKALTERSNHQKLEQEIEEAIYFERRVLERLGNNPGIDQFVHALPT